VQNRGSRIAFTRIVRARRPRVWPLALALALLLASASSDAALARPVGSGAVLPAAETPPKITKQPTNKTVNEDENATFESTASGTPAPSEQWEVSTDGGTSFSPIEGATSTVLTLTAVTAAQNQNQYRANFKNTAGETTSKAVILTVHYPPVITQQPASVTVNEGENASFESAAAANPAASVKWEVSKNAGSTWTAITGATANTLTIEAAKTSQSGWEYRASFKNTLGTAASEPATLTVQKAPAVITNPSSTTADEGNNASFEATASGFPTPTIQWEVSTDGGKTWTEIPGANSDPLVLEAVTHEQNGYEYRAVFKNAAGSATTNAAQLTVLSLPKVTHEPQSVIVQIGETATFESAASGFPAPTVQWEVSTNGGSTFTPIEGAISDTLTIENAQLSQNNNEYRATFTGEGGKATSEAAILTVASTQYNAVAWGQNLYRQLGNGSNNAEFDVPVQVSGLKFVVAVAGGARHSLALIANGKVDAWGNNTDGQLGDGTNTTRSVPIEVPGLSGIAQVAAGGFYSLALTHAGTVEAWGDNESGQLGTGNNVESTTPVAVGGLTGVTAIAAGAEHALALLSNGTVKAWGANESGELGTGNFKASNTPVTVKGLTNVIAVAAGEGFSLALLSNGTVKAWGSNRYGQLADPEIEENSNVPVPAGSLSGVKSIAAGATHALALLSNGTVMAWGEDKFGEIGNGTVKTAVETPSAVTGLAGATAVSAGAQDSVALVGGAVKTWGTNSYGQLGDGTVGGMSSVPVEVPGIAKAASISAGAAHVLAFGEPLPVVTEVSPPLGPSAGGTAVTITGANLAGATSVMFGATPATSFTVNSATSITATAPAESAGTVDIIITTPAGTSPKKVSDRYTFQAPPSVTKISPKSGPVTGETTVVITGSEFTRASAVTFGSVPASKFTVNSATSITATAPAQAAGKVHVTVTNAAGTSTPVLADMYKYTPVVASVSPNSGPLAGGTGVTVTGAGFIQGSGLTRFLFGKTRASSVVCPSTTECTMTSPAGAVTGTVDVIAEAAKAKSPISRPADSFTYT
jgi:alpha-tubulin suppressor-like RCC1 family protein